MGNLTIRPWQTHLLPSKACLPLLLQAGFFLNYCCTFQVAEVTWPPASTSLKTDCNIPKKSILPVLLQPWAFLQEPPQANSRFVSCYSLPCAAPVAPNPTQCGSPRCSYPDTHSWVKASQGSLDCLRQRSPAPSGESPPPPVAECSEGLLITTATHLNPELLRGMSTELVQLHSPTQVIQKETPFCRSAFHTQPNCFQSLQQSRASRWTVQPLHSASGF